MYVVLTPEIHKYFLNKIPEQAGKFCTFVIQIYCLLLNSYFYSSIS
jgi:hypothetical protein